jgi:hypothetical protein
VGLTLGWESSSKHLTLQGLHPPLEFSHSFSIPGAADDDRIGKAIQTLSERLKQLTVALQFSALSGQGAGDAAQNCYHLVQPFVGLCTLLFQPVDALCQQITRSFSVCRHNRKTLEQSVAPGK